jgi:hypothetical protein
MNASLLTGHLQGKTRVGESCVYQWHTLTRGRHMQRECVPCCHRPVQSLPTAHLLELRPRIAPLWSRFNAPEFESPDRNCRKNNLASRKAAPRASPRTRQSRRAEMLYSLITSPPQAPLMVLRPAAGAAHGVDDITSVKPAGQRTSGSSLTSSCAGREHSGRAGSSEKRARGCRALGQAGECTEVTRVR